jgi:SAM-dependent methyltransferase
MNPFDAAYLETPPWDIGRPQDVFVQLEREGQIKSRVLDIGCGTGDLALYLTQRGHETWGIDASPRAIQLAAAKAKQSGALVQLQDNPGEATDASGLSVMALRLQVGDALNLKKLGRSFNTAIDCGFFHALSDSGREKYKKSLEAALLPGGTLHLLCFSDAEPEWGGPRRVTQADLKSCFSGASGWFIEKLERARFENNVRPEGSHAWLLTATFAGKAAPGVN